MNSEDISFLEMLFELSTPFLLLVMNYKIAVKKDKTYFILNFILILISSLLGVALDYLKWGLDAGLNDTTKRSVLLDPDNETIAIEMLLVQYNVIVSTIGSILCSIMLINKRKKKK